MPEAGFTTSFQVPRQRDDHLPRPQLVAKLESHASARLQVVVAPAAYGKTTLLSEFARQSRRKICWFSIEESDADSGVFLRRVHASVRAKFPEIEPLIAYSPGTRGGTPATALVVSLVNAIQNIGDAPVTLIWDDYHRVNDEEQIRSTVEAIVEHLPQNCALVIGSRVTPRLENLEKLVAYRDAYIHTANALRFTASEVQELLALLREEEVPATQAREILDRTEGWVGGVLSLEMGGSIGGDIPRGSAQSLQTFAASALGTAPDEDRWFLQASGVLPYLDPRLCDQALGIDCSAEFLKRAYDRIGFLSQADDGSNTYKWHDMIREGLEAQFQAQHPREYLDVSTRGAGILELRGEIEAALSLYVKAEAYAEAGRLLVHEGERFLREGRWVFLERSLEQLPAQFIERNAPLLELRGRLAGRLLDGESSIGYLNDALACLFPSQPDDLPLEARILISRSSSFQLLGLYAEGVEDAKRALYILGQSEGSRLDLSRAQRQLGSNYIHQGQYCLAEEWLTKALQIVRADGDLYETAYVHGLLGTAYYELGNMPDGHMHLDAAISGWRNLGNLGELSVCLNNLAQLWHRQGQLDVASDLLQEALQCARDSNYARFEAIILVGIADISRDSGDLETAQEYYANGLELARKTSEANLVSYTICMTGETYRLQGDYEKAEIMLRQAESLAESQGQRHERAMARLSLALVEARTEAYDTARDHLQKAEGWLAQSGQAHGMALLDLCRAQIAFLERDMTTSEINLASVADRCQALGYSGFLVSEAWRAPMMFQWAAEKGIRAGFYDRIWEDALARGPRGTGLAPAIGGRLSFKLRAYALGRSSVTMGDKVVTHDQWQSPKARELFFYLLTRSGPVRRETICADLWPDARPATANSNFHSSVRRVRHAIHPTAIVIDDSAYDINRFIDVWYDFSAFMASLERAQALPHASPERAGLLEDAIKNYGGPFLEEFYSEWAEVIRRDTEHQFISTLSELAGFYSGQAEFTRALDLLRHAKEVDQLEENVRMQMMRSYLELGDPPSAIGVYEEYRSLLASELSAQPSMAMRRIRQEAAKAL